MYARLHLPDLLSLLGGVLSEEAAWAGMEMDTVIRVLAVFDDVDHPVKEGVYEQARQHVKAILSDKELRMPAGQVLQLRK
eukprot:gene19536-40106_t